MTDQLPDFPSVSVPLASPDLVRRRGDQRRTRGRLALGAAAALVLVAVAGTAVVLADRPGRPDSLRVATTPSTTTSATPEPTMSRDPKITWAAFPSVTRMDALFPGDWTSRPVQVADQVADAYRCRADVVLAQTARAVVSRRLVTTDFQQQVVFTVQDFASTSDASAVFAHKLEELRRCPTVTTDGPTTGSRQIATVLEVSRHAFTVLEVQHECQRPYTDCTNAPAMQRIAVADHLLLTVTGYRTALTFSPSELKAFMDDFAQHVTTSYGLEATPIDHPTTQSPAVGTTYYGVFLWTGNVGQTNGETQAQQIASSWGHVVTARLDCFEGGASAVGRDHPGASQGDAVALLFDSAQQAEDFVDVYDGNVEGVGRVTMRCPA